LGVTASKVKTSVYVDEKVWSDFKRAVLERGGDVRALSSEVEELLRDALVSEIVVEGLKGLLSGEVRLGLDVKPVKPCVETSAGRVVRELRESRV